MSRSYYSVQQQSLNSNQYRSLEFHVEYIHLEHPKRKVLSCREKIEALICSVGNQHDVMQAMEGQEAYVSHCWSTAIASNVQVLARARGQIGH